MCARNKPRNSKNSPSSVDTFRRDSDACPRPRPHPRTALRYAARSLNNRQNKNVDIQKKELFFIVPTSTRRSARVASIILVTSSTVPGESAGSDRNTTSRDSSCEKRVIFQVSSGNSLWRFVKTLGRLVASKRGDGASLRVFISTTTARLERFLSCRVLLNMMMPQRQGLPMKKNMAACYVSQVHPLCRPPPPPPPHFDATCGADDGLLGVYMEYKVYF